MPVYQNSKGERSYSQDAKLVENIERDLHRDLLAVASDARALVEMAEAVAAEGETYNLDSELRATINEAMGALTDLHAAMPKPRLEAVR